MCDACWQSKAKCEVYWTCFMCRQMKEKSKYAQCIAQKQKGVYKPFTLLRRVFDVCWENKRKNGPT